MIKSKKGVTKLVGPFGAVVADFVVTVASMRDFLVQKGMPKEDAAEAVRTLSSAALDLSTDGETADD